MHPRNIFNGRPDFNLLAEKYDSFKPYVTISKKGRGFLDFKDPLAVKELTVCLLKDSYNLNVDFPIDSLCPAVPNRLNYILWLEDLLDDTASDIDDVIGIDIGVGASCIYPLLGCASNPTWKFLGTDIDPRSVKYAQENVENNALQERITIKHNLDPNKIFMLEDDTTYTFCMCNPPFYSSQAELEEGLSNKDEAPSAVCKGSNSEMITEGGELGFISKIIEESLVLKKKVVWYTSMIGLKRTIRPLIRLLNDAGVDNYVVTLFSQGKTSRWAIAWSFYDKRPAKIEVIQTWSPNNTFEIQLPENTIVVQRYVKEVLEDLDIQYKTEENDIEEVIMDCSVDKNTWSRAARRQKKRQKLNPQEGEDKKEKSNVKPFAFTLEFSQSNVPTRSYLQITWHKGGERAMFEGFWSHLKKRVEENCGLLRGSVFSK